MSRWTRFILAIVVGIALGLLYGWVLSPVKYVDTTPNTLRADYQTDYVLMVAEIYQTENDLALAEQRLTFLSSMPASYTIQKALDYAAEKDYYQADIDLMLVLRDRFEADPIPGSTP